MNREILEKSGIDYTAGVKRFMDDSELYERVLTAFLSDDSFSNASQAFSRGDNKALFEQTHALKGVCGNLDMTALYRASGELAEYLRHNESPDKAVVGALFERLRSAYCQAADGIRAASERG